MSRGFDSETTLGTCWSKSENSWQIYYPSKTDGWLMYEHLSSDTFKELVAELEKRGYDTKTLRISVKKAK